MDEEKQQILIHGKTQFSIVFGTTENDKNGPEVQAIYEHRDGSDDYKEGDSDIALRLTTSWVKTLRFISDSEMMKNLMVPVHLKFM